MERQPTKKTAVDRASEEYWSKYFGPYGKAWVRKIPRRIAHALVQRTAAKGDDLTQLEARARVYPLAHAVTPDGVRLEGTFHVEGGEMGRIFHAAFDHQGRLMSLDSIPAPVALA